MPAYFNSIFRHKPSRHIVSNYGNYPPTTESEIQESMSGKPILKTQETNITKNYNFLTE